MTIEEKVAIEMLAKSLLEYKYRNHTDGSSWESAGRKVRQRYRQIAMDFLQEGW